MLNKREQIMAVITRYVVEHKGVEKFVTADKKEADQYDKMLDVADNLSEYIEGKGIKIEQSVLEELSIMLSKNKDSLSKLLKGITADVLLTEEKADVVDIEAKKAKKA
jgi:dsDNA-binding SOS-regulon protein